MNSFTTNPQNLLTSTSVSTWEKIQVLGKESQYDVCLSSCLGGRLPDPGDPVNRWIYPAVLPSGRIIPILKTLLSNFCQADCLYCANRAHNDRPRLFLKPEELAAAFWALYRAHRVHGLFLSSAIYSTPDQVMSDMIKTVEILRKKYKYTDYVHLKIIPGASKPAIERACEIANRVSVNLEAPDPENLQKIAPAKNFKEDLLKRMEWIDQQIKNGAKAKSQTTQFIVGAGSETDQQILKTVYHLYQEFHLQRAFFSGFQPLLNTPLENHPPTPRIREHRLYQADFLIRHYSFTINDLVFQPEGNLPLETDPKTVWAQKNPQFFPVEINQADFEELIRIPGIGIKKARKIIEIRRYHRFTDPTELKKVQIPLQKASPYILLNGKRISYPHQSRFSFT